MESEKLLAKMIVEADNNSTYATPYFYKNKGSELIDSLIEKMTPKPVLDEYGDSTGVYTPPEKVTVSELKEVQKKYSEELNSFDKETGVRMREIEHSFKPVVKVSKMILGMEE